MDGMALKIRAVIMKKLVAADEPISLGDMFDDVTDLHREVFKHMVRNSDSIEKVSSKYQLR